MFDSQVLRHRGADELPESVLASVSAYYRRATTTSRPMGHLIALVMATLLGSLIVRFATGDDLVWLIAVSVVLAGLPIALQLGARSPTPCVSARAPTTPSGSHGWRVPCASTTCIASCACWAFSPSG